MLFRKSPEKFWNLIAKKYAAGPISDRAAYESKIEKIKSYLSAEYCVLDIGCGTGTQCGDLAAHVKQVTGVDISSKLLAIAEQRKEERKINNVKFLNTTVFEPRFQPQSFDLVMGFYVFHFFEDIDAPFRRIHELLKPGGIFISETACMGEKHKMIGKLMRMLGYLGLVPMINILTNEKIQETLQQAGFEVIEKTRFSESNDEYTYIARKK